MNSSEILFEEAKKVIPGGVNSPVRSFNGVGGSPIFFNKGKGAYIYDTDGREYIDYVSSWGAMIAGHANEKVLNSIKETLNNGTGFGAPTTIETDLAKKIIELMPNIELVRMVNSGTEATMSAIRLARGYTKRNKIIKFEGCYHGHSDSLLVKAGSGALTLGVPTSPGVPNSFAKHTITLEYNNLSQITEVFKEMGEQIACVIVEPVAGNMNLILPKDGFLSTLREVCDEYGSVLIFDEVMTGFRVALGGAQQYFNITPDLTTLGKVIGGGLPIGAFGGKKEIMQHISPLGGVYQAGTLSGNPISQASGLAMLNIVSQDGFYEKLSSKTKALADGILAIANAVNIPVKANCIGGMFGIYFTEDEVVENFHQSFSCDVKRFKKFFHKMLAKQIYLAPSAFEAGFLSIAHSDADIDRTLQAVAVSLKDL